MHVWLNNEILNGMFMMKYAVNHHWKFKFHRTAALAGFMQFSAMFLIAIANYMVIQISESAIDIAKDFTALLIISDFDDIFTSLSGSTLADDIVSAAGDEYEPMFIVEVTTSNDANSPRENTPLEPDEVYDKMVKYAPKKR